MAQSSSVTSHGRTHCGISHRVPLDSKIARKLHRSIFVPPGTATMIIPRQRALRPARPQQNTEPGLRPGARQRIAALSCRRARRCRTLLTPKYPTRSRLLTLVAPARCAPRLRPYEGGRRRPRHAVPPPLNFCLQKYDYNPVRCERTERSRSPMASHVTLPAESARKP